MQIFAICGFKGTGKDAIANIIGTFAHQNERYTRKMAFADPMKDIFINSFNLRGEMDYDKFKRGTMTLSDNRIIQGRDVLRNMAMKLREYNSEFFIEKIEDRVKNLEWYHPEEFDTAVVVISDLRFSNELKWLKDNNAVIIKVKKDSETSDGHVSERGIPDHLCDYIVDNNGTYTNLETQVKDIVRKELKVDWE